MGSVLLSRSARMTSRYGMPGLTIIDVGALVLVQLRLPQRLAVVGRVLLVGPLVGRDDAPAGACGGGVCRLMDAGHMAGEQAGTAGPLSDDSLICNSSRD